MAAPAKKKPGIDLAILMGGPPKKGPAMASEDDDGEDMDDPMAMEAAPEGEESSGAFDSAYEEFTDEALPPEERKAAFKRAVMACMEGDY